MNRLSGKVAMITGSTSGIGLAIARKFAAEGAKVILSGRRETELANAAREIGERAVALPGDVADPGYHDFAERFVSEEFGGLDVYVANAGIIAVADSSVVTEQEYDAMFATNARGVFFGVQRMSAAMRQGGAIVLTSSIAGDKMLDGHSVYAGTKAAIGAFARNWAREFSSRGIRVNVLSPGPTETAIVDRLSGGGASGEALRRDLSASIPLGRLGRVDDLANAALFLASEDSSFVTGVNLRVDGGMSLL